MAEMEIVPVYRGNEMVLPITGVNAVMDGEGNNLPMIFAKKDATTSDAWDPDITYTTGQYCLDNNTLWRCLIQNENTKPEEGTYWTRETIGNNLITTDGEGNRGYLKADGSFIPFSSGSGISQFNININYPGACDFVLFTADKDMTMKINGHLESRAYGSVNIYNNDTVITTMTGTWKTADVDTTINLKKGDNIRFVVGLNGGADTSTNGRPKIDLTFTFE